jgi:3-methyladenine DNA glycosylase AlkD
MKNANSHIEPKSACREIIAELRTMKNPVNIAGMARYGINSSDAFGVPMPYLRAKAKHLGKNHRLALELWDAGVHETKILAALVDEPASVTEKQMEKWVADFASWDVCDQVCSNLFDKTPFAYKKAVEWTTREKEFVKRAGYVMMAALSVHDKKAPDEVFVKFLPLIESGADDERNFVKKAVNWALRSIGKRNAALNRSAIATAERIRASGSKPARWIAADALRELNIKRTAYSVQRTSVKDKKKNNKTKQLS